MQSNNIYLSPNDSSRPKEITSAELERSKIKSQVKDSNSEKWTLAQSLMDKRTENASSGTNRTIPRKPPSTNQLLAERTSPHDELTAKRAGCIIEMDLRFGCVLSRVPEMAQIFTCLKVIGVLQLCLQHLTFVSLWGHNKCFSSHPTAWHSWTPPAALFATQTKDGLASTNLFLTQPLPILMVMSPDWR
jgi:hypothetical protein